MQSTSFCFSAQHEIKRARLAIAHTPRRALPAITPSGPEAPSSQAAGMTKTNPEAYTSRFMASWLTLTVAALLLLARFSAASLGPIEQATTFGGAETVEAWTVGTATAVHIMHDGTSCVYGCLVFVCRRVNANSNLQLF